MTIDKDKNMWRNTSLVATFVLMAALVSAQTGPKPPLPPKLPVAPALPRSPVIPPEIDLKLDDLGFAIGNLDVHLDGLDAVIGSAVEAGIRGGGAGLEGLSGLAGLEALDAVRSWQGTGVGGGSSFGVGSGRSQDSDYSRGTTALDAGRYESAVTAFDRVIAKGGTRVDGAMYWKAYAQNRLGKRTEALATIDELLKKFPASRWTNDAKALQLDVRQASGQSVSPDAASDEELKLMALQGLLHSDPSRALSTLEKMLQSNESPRVKERALFVLAQTGSPQTRDILGRLARGQGNPDLQLKAVRFLALFGGKESRQILSDVYTANSDVDVRRQVLQAFMLAGDRDRLLQAARTEKNADLRMEAVRQLGIMGARVELGELYTNELSAEVKKQVLQSLFMAGASDRLLQIARAETDAALRKTAVRNLGLIDAAKTGDALVQIYREDKDLSVKKTAIQGLFMQQNAAALVQLARQETNFELKKDLVSKLSLMQSKDAADYMMEILKK
ncbi:MAG TPA: HEAT repeat domain-containing protein [Vicinamibacterales bacterium]|jgi:HEAT repeat protein